MESIIVLLLGMLVVFATFLILRELVLWYYKIPLRIRLQTEANTYLKKISEQNEEILKELKNNKQPKTE